MGSGAVNSDNGASGQLACNVRLAGGNDTVDSQMASERRNDWSGVGNRRWSPWGTALCDEVAEHADRGVAVLGPITLSGYDADKRWKLRDTVRD